MTKEQSFPFWNVEDRLCVVFFLTTLSEWSRSSSSSWLLPLLWHSLLPSSASLLVSIDHFPYFCFLLFIHSSAKNSLPSPLTTSWNCSVLMNNSDWILLSPLLCRVTWVTVFLAFLVLSFPDSLASLFRESSSLNIGLSGIQVGSLLSSSQFLWIIPSHL